MPIYSYGCKACGDKVDLIRPIKNKDDLVRCPNDCGPMKPLIAVPAGLIGRAVPASPVSDAEDVQRPGPNIFMRNVTANRCGGGFMMANGPHRIRLDGATITNTPEAFRLGGGATVEGSDIRYSPGDPPRRWQRNPTG